MRISTRMFTDNYVANLEEHQARLFRLQQQAATGKRILNPSDDPIAATQASAASTALQATKQYLINVSEAKTLAEHSSTVVKAALKSVDDAMVVAEHGGNDTLSAADRKALAETVNQLLEAALDTANDRSLGRYTLSGTHTGTQPYVAVRNAQGQIASVTLDPSVTSDSVNRQVDANNVLKVNLNGPDTFGGTGSPAGSTDYFATLVQLRDALASNDGTAVRAIMPQMQALHDQVSSQVALSGSMWQRIDSVQSKLEGQEINLEANRSRLQDVDVAKAAVDLQTEQNIYQQALAVGNKILSLNLSQLLG
jgi:flagellar hook-associated protein 3 FlgL